MSPFCLALAVTLQAPAAPSADPCSALVPASVQDLVGEGFPGYRVARASEYSLQELHDRESQRLPACPAVATADADGNGLPDMAFFITAEGKPLLLVASMQSEEAKWRLVRLENFGPGGPSRNFVEALKPASYRDGSSGYSPEPGRVRSHKATNPGFRAGRLESASMAFFFDGKRWVHLYLEE